MADLSIIHLVSHADGLVKCVMGLLFLASLASWAIIFDRIFLLRKAKKVFMKFEKQFWESRNLGALFESIEKSARAQNTVPEGAEHLFFKGYQERLKLDHAGVRDPQGIMESVNRVMKVALMREGERLQKGLGWLASAGSVSPYVGLFGTVWGIMNAFQSLGAVAQATLSMVAPGISEALVATAMGLFVAIPSVLAYNRFVASSDHLLNEYENFQEEFSVLLKRQLEGK